MPCRTRIVVERRLVLGVARRLEDEHAQDVAERLVDRSRPAFWLAHGLDQLRRHARSCRAGPAANCDSTWFWSVMIARFTPSRYGSALPLASFSK